MKLLNLSNDLVNLIGECLDNQRLAKLLFYKSSTPLSEPSVDTYELAPFGKYERILPHPFDIDFTADVRSQLHIYFPRLEFKNSMIVEDVTVFFDVVVHKSIWTIRDEKNKKAIRPYLIAQEVINEVLDQIHFYEFTHLAVNEEFQAIRIEGQLLKWNDKYASEY